MEQQNKNKLENNEFKEQKQNKQENENTLQKSHEEKFNHNDRSFRINFKNKVEYLSLQDICNLQYFMDGKLDNTKVIELYGFANFDIDDIKTLNRCIGNNKIDSKVLPTESNLIGLIDADNYFHSKDKFITVKKLFNYFANEVLLNEKEINKLQNCSNLLVKDAITQIANEKKHKKMNNDKNFIINSKHIPNIHEIIFEELTHFQILLKRLSITMIVEDTQVKLKLKYAKFGEITHLINDCENVRLMLEFSDLNNIIKHSIASNITHKHYYCTTEEYEILDHLLCCVLDVELLNENKDKFIDITYQDYIFRAIYVRYKLSLSCGTFDVTELIPVLSLLDKKLLGGLTSKFLTISKKCNSLQRFKERTTLLKYCILQCPEDWKIRNVNLWFKFLNEKCDAKSFIIKKILNKASLPASIDYLKYFAEYMQNKSNIHNVWNKDYETWMKNIGNFDWELQKQQK